MREKEPTKQLWDAQREVTCSWGPAGRTGWSISKCFNFDSDWRLEQAWFAK